ncbi:histidine--tRNA ligase family protein, partial [Candidatus Saccharibacteria bacterium]|nr:histidine--tRNA ligase family protein [Candidatus Saccharibacteria bacterium]
QKGRFREFYQCDVDIIGRNELPLVYDAQVIATFYDALKSFLNTEVKIRLNNRKFVSGVLGALGVSDKSAEIYAIIDHAEKVPAEKTREALVELGLPEDTVVKITTLINTHGDYEMVARLGYENAGLAELKQVSEELEKLGLKGAFEIDVKIVRGLDYYTGTVFETALPEYPSLGSVGSGGRYDNLASNYTDQKFPGVGASIGLSRLFYVMQENGLLDPAKNASLAMAAPVDIAIIPMNSDLRADAYKLAEKLRKDGKSVDVVLTDKKLGDMMKYAAKVAKSGIVLGESEVESGTAKVKDFSTGDQAEIKL